jgi:hypothetical protein
MRNRQSTSEWTSLLGKYKAAGGVLDYLLLEPGPAGGDPAVLHREAALATMEHVRQTYSHWAGFIHVYPEKLEGREIDKREFLGPCFDEGAGAIRVPVAYEPPEYDFEQPDAGYAYAFAAPPYGLLIPMEERQALFDAVNSVIFGGIESELQIYRWSDEVSNYFSAGRDWWGCYFWTVYNADKGLLVGIAGSSSD